MPEYRFVLLSSNRLHIEHAEVCLNDDQAMTVARRLVATTGKQYRVEIWRDDDCIYGGTPSVWPFRRAGAASPPRGLDGGDDPPREA